MAGCQSAPLKSAETKPLEAAPAGGDEILATDISFDLETGQIKYTLPEDALVRVRIGLMDGGPLLHHVVDWEKRLKGPHVETWDRKDAAGKIDFTNRKDMMLVLGCLPLEEEKRKSYNGLIKGLRKAPQLNVVFPEAVGKTDDGWDIVRGIAPVRINLDEKDKDWLTGTKYEVGMYIDYVFLMEDEEGTNPFTYRLNTVNLNDGPHLITVNIVGYEGDMGTRSVLVYVKNN